LTNDASFLALKIEMYSDEYISISGSQRRNVRQIPRAGKLRGSSSVDLSRSLATGASHASLLQLSIIRFLQTHPVLRRRMADLSKAGRHGGCDRAVSINQVSNVSPGDSGAEGQPSYT
jgi:hypothetical protein